MVWRCGRELPLYKMWRSFTSLFLGKCALWTDGQRTTGGQQRTDTGATALYLLKQSSKTNNMPYATPKH